MLLKYFRNIFDVIYTKEWDDFIQLKPQLLNQIFESWIEKFF
jgi:hypothetical protein